MNGHIRGGTERPTGGRVPRGSRVVQTGSPRTRERNPTNPLLEGGKCPPLRRRPRSGTFSRLETEASRGFWDPWSGSPRCSAWAFNRKSLEVPGRSDLATAPWPRDIEWLSARSLACFLPCVPCPGSLQGQRKAYRRRSHGARVTRSGAPSATEGPGALPAPLAKAQVEGHSQFPATDWFLCWRGAKRGQEARLEASPVESRASECPGSGPDVRGVTSGYWGHIPLVKAAKERLRLGERNCYRRWTNS